MNKSKVNDFGQHHVNGGKKSAIPMTDNTKGSQPEEESSRRCDRKRGLPLFVANMCAIIICYVMLNIYSLGVVRTIERRFALRSSQTGLIASCNDITHICLVIFIGYFGRRGNKPKIMCFTVMFSALAGILNASPHFILASYKSNHDRDHRSQAIMSSYANNDSEHSHLRHHQQFCEKLQLDSNATSRGDDCPAMDDQKVADAGSVHPAFYVFVVAQLISGVGSSGIFTLGLTYIDENSPRKKAALYIGILTSSYSFGPITGFMLAALCLSLPENLTSGTDEKSSDPSFIGCWWLGYLVGGLALAIFAIPLWFYPKQMVPHHTRNLAVKDKLTEHDEDVARKREEIAGLLEQAKEFPRALMHLLRNKAYVCNLGDIVCGAYIIYGVYVNMVRYIEIHFMERAFVGSIIAGVVSAMAGIIGGFSGGVIMSRFRLRPTGAVKIILFASSFLATGITIILFLGCPQLQMAGQKSPDDGSFSVITQCNQHCDCSTSRKSFNPVCGSDNLTYFSPCVAGCFSLTNESYTDCGCISGEDGSSSARPGLCTPKCTLLIPFAITLAVMSPVGALARVPSTMVSLRIVDDNERSFALGINSFAFNLLGLIPAPLLFGYMIDSTCILWQTTCKKTGVCLLFNTAKFRHLTFGVALTFEIISIVFALAVLMIVRKMPINKMELNLSHSREKKIPATAAETIIEQVEQAITIL